MTSHFGEGDKTISTIDTLDPKVSSTPGGNMNQKDCLSALWSPRVLGRLGLKVRKDMKVEIAGALLS